MIYIMKSFKTILSRNKFKYLCNKTNMLFYYEKSATNYFLCLNDAIWQKLQLQIKVY